MNAEKSNWFVLERIVVIVSVVLSISCILYFRRQVLFLLSIEPRYHGQTLGYWTDHAFDYYGSQRLTNDDAAEAIRSIGKRGLPFLVKWIATPSHSSQGIDYESRALHGFEILGPAAKPAIPGLLKVIGRNNNWPAVAMSHIGT